jgi:hypothetical protein
MNDARRYRMNAAECLLAAKTCEPSYRSVLLTTSAAWYALAIEVEEIDRLLAKWSEPAPVQVPATARDFGFSDLSGNACRCSCQARRRNSFDSGRTTIHAELMPGSSKGDRLDRDRARGGE